MTSKRVLVSELKDELDDVSSYHRTLNARNVCEKILWISIAICGTAFIFHIVKNQFIYWDENQVLITKKSISLSELKKPSVTYCNKALHKFGVAERLINYFDSGTGSSKDILSMQTNILKSYIEEKSKLDKKYNGHLEHICSDQGQFETNCEVSSALIRNRIQISKYFNIYTFSFRIFKWDFWFYKKGMV